MRPLLLQLCAQLLQSPAVLLPQGLHLRPVARLQRIQVGRVSGLESPERGRVPGLHLGLTGLRQGPLLPLHGGSQLLLLRAAHGLQLGRQGQHVPLVSLLEPLELAAVLLLGLPKERVLLGRELLRDLLPLLQEPARTRSVNTGRGATVLHAPPALPTRNTRSLPCRTVPAPSPSAVHRPRAPPSEVHGREGATQSQRSSKDKAAHELSGDAGPTARHRLRAEADAPAHAR